MKSFTAAVGCALAVTLGGSPAHSAEPLIAADESAATAEAGYGRVFGRLVVFDQGEALIWGSSPLFTRFGIFVRSLKTDQVERVAITAEDGSFYWPLKPGEYVIALFSYAEKTGRLWLTFSVPEPGKAAYIGDLHVVFEKSRYRFGVKDEYTRALKNVEARLTEAKLEPVSALMRPEGRLGTYKNVLNVCSPAWGLECDRTYQGVVTLQPEGTYKGFPTTASLTPLLEWKPSKDEGVTYDVAIYEFLVLDPFDVPGAGRHRERGKLAAYAEGLKEPKLQLDTPLQPGKKYLWSVRLRKGDFVSTWSVSSYFDYFVIGWRKGSGQWHGFTTPEK
jgi:hypothetical protein